MQSPAPVLTLRELFPDLPEDELAKVEEFFRDYLEIVREICRSRAAAFDSKGQPD